MTTYAQMKSAAHAAGGETQTEATAKMTNLYGKPANFLFSILTSLNAEAAACHTEHDYVQVRAQVGRVRSALIAKGWDLS